MDYKWEVEGEVHIYEERSVKRYLIAPMTMFPVLLKLQNGDLLAVVRGGEYHLGERGRLDCVRSRDGGISWGRPSTIVAEGPDDRNPSAIQCSNGDILVAFSKADMYVNGVFSQEKAETKRKESRPNVWLTRSEDNGQTWSQAKLIEEFPTEVGMAVYGKSVEYPQGTICLSLKSEFLARSTDFGQTWGDFTKRALNNETAYLYLPSGKAISMIRRNEKGVSLWQADSFDGGRTWGEPRQITGYMEHPADLILLQSGKILLTYGRRRPPYGIQAMLSYDEGENWDTKHKITLVSDAEDMEVGYPSSVQLDDGTICTAYYSYQDLFHITDRYRGYNSWGLHTAAVRYQEEDLLP